MVILDFGLIFYLKILRSTFSFRIIHKFPKFDYTKKFLTSWKHQMRKYWSYQRRLRILFYSPVKNLRQLSTTSVGKRFKIALGFFVFHKPEEMTLKYLKGERGRCDNWKIIIFLYVFARREHFYSRPVYIKIFCGRSTHVT